MIWQPENNKTLALAVIKKDIVDFRNPFLSLGHDNSRTTHKMNQFFQIFVKPIWYV
jgi:hypothetical protein